MKLWKYNDIGGTKDMRVKQSIDENWMYYIGEVGPVAKTSPKSGAIAGLTNALGNELFEPFAGAMRTINQLKRVLPVGEGIELEDETLLRMFCNMNYTLEGWKKVKLPHDFRLEMGFSTDPNTLNQGSLPNGICYYRKTFKIPKEDEGKRIVLEFDGVMRAASFWYNGCFLGDHYSGYCGFEFDVTELTKYGDDEGDNVLLVRCDTTTGNEGWWYEGGGIYRHVWLTKYEPLHVGRWGVFVKPQIKGKDAEVTVEVTVCNQYEYPCKFIAETKLIDNQGKCIGTINAKGEVEVAAETVVKGIVSVKDIQLWDCEHPILYKAQTAIIVEDKTIDEYETTFGFRTIEYTLEGLKLNGKAVPIYGACVHQDFAGVGAAQIDAIHAYKIKRLKEMGMNAYRSAHNPATIELLEECDKQGMLVLDENRLIETTRHRMEDLEELIKRGRNHPSIFAWSLSNEELFSGSYQAKRILKTLLPFARRLDNTRPYVAAEAFILPEEAEEYGCSLYDVFGINYAESTMNNSKFCEIHEKFPKMKIMNSENTSWFTTRGIYEDNRAKGQCSSYGTRFAMMGGEGGPNAGGTATPVETWHFYKDNPMTGGFFVWTGFDYRGEPSPCHESQVSSNFGAMDTCGFAKDDYYYYQSVCTEKPMIHIMPHWTWDKKGEVKNIRVYTNCKEAELFLNGKSLGIKKLEKDWIPWEVAYEPGELKAVGYSDRGEEVVDIKQTAGEPAQLRVTADKEVLCADGKDVSFVTVEVCDKDGILVPKAENCISVEVTGSGALLGLGNGDPASREDDKGDKKHAFSGLIMALVQAQKSEGDISVVATSEGLLEGKIELKAQK